MATPQHLQRPPDELAEYRISHWIPPVELTGSRRDKLKKLDILIDYLQDLRFGLSGKAEASPASGGLQGPSRHIGRPDWPWLAAGLMLGVLFVLVLVAARAFA